MNGLLLSLTLGPAKGVAKKYTCSLCGEKFSRECAVKRHIDKKCANEDNSSKQGQRVGKGVVKIYPGEGLQEKWEGHHFLCFEKGRVTIFSAVTKGRVISFHGIVWCKRLTEVNSKIPVSFFIESDKKLSCIRSCITPGDLTSNF